MGEVVKPRVVRYSATCHEWLIHGVCARRILPTIWVHRCSVAQVSFQAAKGSSGQRLTSGSGGISFSFCLVVNEQLVAVWGSAGIGRPMRGACASPVM